MGEVAVDHPVRPGGGSECHVRGISTRNARHDEVRLAEIEARVESQSHDRRGGSRRTDARADAQHALLVHAKIAIAGGKGKDLIEFLAFHPMLKFAGKIARVGTALEQRDDNYFYLSRLVRCENRNRNESKQEESGHPSRVPRY